MANNEFEILYPGLFYGLVVIAGFTDLDNTPAIYPLANMAPSVISFLTTNNTVFTIYNGCYQLYDGIRNYIGTENVLVNANIVASNRPQFGHITLTVEVDSSIKEISCRKLVVSHPQVLSDLEYLHLDEAEINVFKHASVAYYYVAAFNFESNILGVNAPVAIDNFNPGNPYYYPNWPAITNVMRGLPYGPGAISACSNVSIAESDMLEIIKEQMNKAVPVLFESYDIFVYKPHDRFGPHFDLPSLSASPNVYTQLSDLQGHLNTFWIGALPNFC